MYTYFGRRECSGRAISLCVTWYRRRTASRLSDYVAGTCTHDGHRRRLCLVPWQWFPPFCPKIIRACSAGQLASSVNKRRRRVIQQGTCLIYTERERPRGQPDHSFALLCVSSGEKKIHSLSVLLHLDSWTNELWSLEHMHTYSTYYILSPSQIISHFKNLGESKYLKFD